MSALDLPPENLPEDNIYSGITCQKCGKGIAIYECLHCGADTCEDCQAGWGVWCFHCEQIP